MKRSYYQPITSSLKWATNIEFYISERRMVCISYCKTIFKNRIIWTGYTIIGTTGFLIYCFMVLVARNSNLGILKYRDFRHCNINYGKTWSIWWKYSLESDSDCDYPYYMVPISKITAQMGVQLVAQCKLGDKLWS